MFDKDMFNMCLNGIAIYLHAPLIAALKISVLLVISHNIQVLRHICQMVFIFFHMNNHLRYY